MGVGKDKGRLTAAAELRRQAEAKLREDTNKTLPLPQSETEAQRLLHELQIHQVELEMQNAELRQARDEAERTLERYSDLYDFSPVGYVTFDREGLIRAANLTVATLLGIERSRLLGRNFGSFVVADTAPDFIAFINRIFTSQTKEACEVALLSGTAPPLFVRIEAVATVSGEECRAAVLDISARRQLEETLQALHRDLLAHAAELEAANIELEAFNYSVSHDLRGPLTVIAGYCEVVEQLCGSKLDEQCRGYIQTIHEGTMRMNRLINTLLDFSKVKGVKMLLDKVDLSNLAEEVAMKLRETDPARRVTFRFTKEIMADGDASLLLVVLDNLIGNAWKYSGKGKETMIEFDVTDIGGKRAYLVRDNGPGFDMEHAGKLFVPFQRLPGTDVEGHGIGLAIVDRIIRRHGGRVWAESKSGEGTTFFFTLGETLTPPR